MVKKKRVNLLKNSQLLDYVSRFTVIQWETLSGKKRIYKINRMTTATEVYILPSIPSVVCIHLLSVYVC